MTSAVQSIAIGSGESQYAASIWTRAVSWLQTCSDYLAAAAMYDELRGLSDAELRRRGLSRDSLARDVCATCDRYR
jgi:hypothetical protein